LYVDQLGEFVARLRRGKGSSHESLQHRCLDRVQYGLSGSGSLAESSEALEIKPRELETTLDFLLLTRLSNRQKGVP